MISDLYINPSLLSFFQDILQSIGKCCQAIRCLKKTEARAKEIAKKY